MSTPRTYSHMWKDDVLGMQVAANSVRIGALETKQEELSALAKEIKSGQDKLVSSVGSIEKDLKLYLPYLERSRAGFSFLDTLYKAAIYVAAFSTAFYVFKPYIVSVFQ